MNLHLSEVWTALIYNVSFRVILKATSGLQYHIPQSHDSTPMIMIGMFKKKKKRQYTLSELSYRCGLGEDETLNVERVRTSASPNPSPHCWSTRCAPLPLPAGFSRSLRHILSPHLSQHIKLSVLPQLHTQHCCHAKHRSAWMPDCFWPACAFGSTKKIPSSYLQL